MPAVRSYDPCTDSDPLPLWYSIEAETAARHEHFATGGPENGPFRRMHIQDLDDFAGERSELGQNDWRQAVTFCLYEEGDHCITKYWCRIPSSFPINGTDWQIIMQMKHTQAHPTSSSSSPPIQLYAFDGKLTLSVDNDAGAEVTWDYTTPQLDEWFELTYDVTYSQDDLIATTQLTITDSTGTTSSPVLARGNMCYATASDQYYDVDDTLVSHLRIGIYRNSLYTETTYVDFAEIEVEDQNAPSVDVDLIQEATGGPSDSPSSRVTTTTATLDATATVDSLLVSVVAIDKDAGAQPSPSAGWTLLQGGNYASVSGAMAYRVADGTATDDCAWSWSTSQFAAWWIGEFEWDGTVPNAVSAIEDTDAAANTAISTLTVGPVTANGHGRAVAAVALDTITSWGTPFLRPSYWDQNEFGDNAGAFIGHRIISDADAVSADAASVSQGTDQAFGMVAALGGLTVAAGAGGLGYRNMTMMGVG